MVFILSLIVVLCSVVAIIAVAIKAQPLRTTIILTNSSIECTSLLLALYLLK
jgi:hypothetical protein